MGGINDMKSWKGIFVILAVVFLLMLLLNTIVPMVADDYSYLFNFGTGERNKTLTDIFSSLCFFYADWSGRLILNGLAQLFMMMDKSIFNVSNALIFTLLIFLLYKHIIGTNKPACFPLLFVCGFVWLCTPVFGQTILWTTGAFIYLCGSVFALLFLFPYRLLVDKHIHYNKWFVVFMFFSGVTAGLTMENIALGTLAVTISLLFEYCQINKRKPKELPLWTVSGLIGLTAGIVILISAPGNFVRASQSSEQAQISINYLLSNAVYAFVISGVFLFIPFILVLSILIYRKRHYAGETKVHKTYKAYLIGVFTCILSMSISPYFPPRATFAPFVFLVIVIGLLLFQNIGLVWKKTLYRYGMVFLAIVILVFTFAVDDLLHLNYSWKNRIAYISELHDPDEADIVFDIIVPKTKYNPVYMLVDLGEDSNEWPNNDIAKALGVKSVRGNKAADSKTIVDIMYELKEFIVTILHK